VQTRYKALKQDFVKSNLIKIACCQYIDDCSGCIWLYPQHCTKIGLKVGKNGLQEKPHDREMLRGQIQVEIDS